MSTAIVQKSSIKKKLLRIFFTLEIIIFTCMYLFGMQGLSALRQLQHDNKQLDYELAQAQATVHELDKEIADWKRDPFYQEKLAREHLHMARAGEIIFITN